MLLPSKTVAWEHLFSPVATQHIPWEALFTHHNKLLHDRLEPLHTRFHSSQRATPTIRKSLSALPPSDRSSQWKGWNFL